MMNIAISEFLGALALLGGVIGLGGLIVGLLLGSKNI